MKELNEILKNVTTEQESKIKSCKTVQEVLDTADSEEIAISIEQAEMIMNIITAPEVQLLDEVMDQVDGGCSTHYNSTSTSCQYCKAGNCLVHGIHK